MKSIVLFGAALLMASLSFTQDTHCGSTTYLRTLQEFYPEEYNAIQAAETEAVAHNNVSTTYKSNGGVYTIPVVVHIVYKTAAQNIDDDFVFSQIDVLNEDYRRMNADAGNTPAAFTGVAADAQIEFCLAQQDENGVITTGITRTETDITSWSLFVSPTDDSYADNVKFTDKGGEDGWTRTKYLNIWVCNLGSGLLGYATPPGGAVAKDGVVIGYKYFGDGSPGGVYNKGRTATHEIGHWLGLWHTWGDDGGSCTGSDDMGDTPNQASETYGNPSFPKLDACSPSSPGIMFMNYMDYTDDGAMNMFTDDQADKMRSVLETTRSTILTSPGCQTGGVDVNEVLKNLLISLSVYPNPSSDNFVFEMKNFEHPELTIEVYDLTGRLVDRIFTPNAETQHVAFDASALSAGTYLVKVSDGEFTLTQEITVAK